MTWTRGASERTAGPKSLESMALGPASSGRHSRPAARPASSAWLKLAERFLWDLTDDDMRVGSFRSARELAEAITSHPTERNKNSRTYKSRAARKSSKKSIEHGKHLPDHTVNRSYLRLSVVRRDGRGQVGIALNRVLDQVICVDYTSDDHNPEQKEAMES